MVTVPFLRTVEFSGTPTWHASLAVNLAVTVELGVAKEMDLNIYLPHKSLGEEFLPQNNLADAAALLEGQQTHASVSWAVCV